jgi:hypothetical protein
MYQSAQQRNFKRVAKIAAGPLALYALVAALVYLFDHKAENDPAPWFAIGVVLGPIFWISIFTSIDEIKKAVRRRTA